MALQLSVAVRNARLDAIEAAIGTVPILKIRTGAPPANCVAADSGVVLSTMTLPVDWMAAASAGQKGKVGTWEDPSAEATGTAGHFRVYASDGVVCCIQGTVSGISGGGDLELQSVSIVTGQRISIVTFTLTDDNA